MKYSKNDPFGAAVYDYYNSRFKGWKKIKVNSSISGVEKIPVSYLFRSINKMPKIEAKALSLCKGKTLDVGACAGSHAIELIAKGIDVDALDISGKCCETMKQRGLPRVICSDIYGYNITNYDTILLLMNGIGIAGTIMGLRKLLQHLSKILLPSGQIIFDSSDIEYSYLEKDGSVRINLNAEYYGEVKYTVQYKDIKGSEFDWLFIDQDKMQKIAEEEGFSFSIVEEGPHYDYLGILKPLGKSN